MANEIRIRRNNISGTTTDNPLLIGATTINSPGFVDLPVIDTTNHLILILDPLETTGAAEIVQVTAHTAASSVVTVIRGAEGSTPRQHGLGTTWFHGPVASDYTSPKYAFSVTNNANQSHTAGAPTTILFQVETYDPANRFASNTYTVPVTGLYFFAARDTYIAAATADNRHILRIVKNGVEAIRDDVSDRGTQNNDVFTLGVAGQFSCTAGDLMAVTYESVAGASTTLAGLAFFEGHYIGDLS